jgi:hypothetical protein
VVGYSGRIILDLRRIPDSSGLATNMSMELIYNIRCCWLERMMIKKLTLFFIY